MATDKAVPGFAVVFWNEDIQVWFTWDKDCDGAICLPLSHSDPIAMFSTRGEARKAIGISRAFARLCKAQGRPVNDDFIDPKCLRCIRIVQLQKKVK